MLTLARRSRRSLRRLVALAAAALAHGAMAAESGHGDQLLRLPSVPPDVRLGPAAEVPTFLDATRLSKVEEAYRTLAGESDGESREEAPHALGQQRPPAAAIEPHSASDLAQRFARTDADPAESSNAPPPADPSAGGSRNAYPADAGGWVMHAADGASEAAAGGALQARSEEAASPANDTERRPESDLGPRPAATQAVASEKSDPPSGAGRARRPREREQPERRGNEIQKEGSRESRRDARPQAERSAGARRNFRDADKRAAPADERKPRGPVRAEPAPGRAPPHPPEFEPPPPPRVRAFGLFGILRGPEPEPPVVEPGRPALPNEIRPYGSYLR